MIQFIFGLTVLAEDIPFEPSIKIPSLDVGGDSVGPPAPITITGDFSALTKYISGIYRFGMAITGILAVIVLALGGITWLTSGGNANSIAKAKQYIWGSITGLVLALLSYTLLNMVNPDIVALKRPPSITQLSAIATEGCLWKQTECDLRFQKEQTKTECGAKPLKNNEPDGSYTHCCCNAKFKDPEFVEASTKCKKLGDKAFISISMGVGETKNDVELKKSCQDACSDKKGIMNYEKVSEGKMEYACCVCNADVSELSGTVPCRKGMNDCDALINKDKIQYTCWLESSDGKNGTCKPCVKKGGFCSGAYKANYECCSGECDANWGDDACE